jgi:hypothetical protein
MCEEAVMIGATAGRKPQIELFTSTEHQILTAWFARDEADRPRPYQADPAVDAAPGSPLDGALNKLGFVTDPGQFFWRSDAAVGSILLQSVEQTLPQWGVVYPDGEIATSRKYSDPDLHVPRKIELMPKALFTIDWGGGPGNSWPESYKLIWVPRYDRYVVTLSSDSPEVYGYCDFALGHFGRDVEPLEAAKQPITRFWNSMKVEADQEQWERLFSSAAISREKALAWRESVWPPPAIDDDDDEDY